MSLSYLDEVVHESDGLGLTLFQGARVYKKVGTGLVTRLHTGNTRMQVENNAGTILGTYWDSGNLPLDWTSPTLTLGLGDTITNPRLALQHNSAVAGGSEIVLTGAGAASDSNSGKLYWGNGFRLIGTTQPLWKFQVNVAGAWTTVFEKASTAMSDLTMKFYGDIEMNNATADRAVVFNAAKRLVASATTLEELSWVSGVTSAIQPQIDGKQARIYKTVFQTANSGTNAGWVRLGTMTGDNQSRFEIRITGKQGWNDQNYPGQAILHGSTNYVGSDTGQIAAGCKWIESTGSSTVATEFALVRQSGYPTAKFDLYVLLDAGFVGWLVEVTTMAAGGWVTNVAYNQTNPGTGSNVFKPTRTVAWDSSWVPSPIGGSGTVGRIPKFTSTTTLANGLLEDTGTEVRLDAGIFRIYNPNLTDFCFALTRKVSGVPDTNSAFVMRMDGKQEWGPGGGSDRDTYLYRSALGTLKTEGTFEANFLKATANSTPTTSANSIWLTAPIVANRSSTSGTTTVAGVGFHNKGVNAALLYYDPSTSKFMYNRHAGGPLLTLLDTEALNPSDSNLGSTCEGVSDPFHSTQRYTAFDKRGGVRTWHGVGPFSGSEDWYNVVDVTHRNGGGDGSAGYGGILAWGMSNFTTRMAFASRSVSGTYSWTEVWTKADISDSNMPRRNATQTWTGINTFSAVVDIRGGWNSSSPGQTFMAFPTSIWRYSADGTSKKSAIWQGGDASGPMVILSPNVGQIAHTAFGTEGSSGLVSTPLLEWSSIGLKVGKLQDLRFTSDIHVVTSSDVTMTEMRARIDSTTAREVTLPSVANHSLAIIMVYSDALTGFHNVVPPSGSEIQWTDHAGTSRYTVPSGGMAGSSFRLTRGAYWFISDGSNWFAVSPGRN